MLEIHCHQCGGFIDNPGSVSYALPNGTETAAPHTALCPCDPPMVYGPPPGHMSSPGMPGVGAAVK